MGHSARGLDANGALGFASCFIDISAARLVLYFTNSTRSNALKGQCAVYEAM